MARLGRAANPGMAIPTPLRGGARLYAPHFVDGRAAPPVPVPDMEAVKIQPPPRPEPFFGPIMARNTPASVPTKEVTDILRPPPFFSPAEWAL